ncbi:TadE/TadG family type IV pilus assembly protein [Sphingomonas sp. PAMC 26605]|uniref:TadE/TadG family type IV pilus assembly protein n=1 Tax=Sphingomonas sp. PAMC 26605 TaxID=1112214 RepID=UPI000684AB70|nr:pilus assembly protein TadG-related protein [Sphingomonas sp. PAMC 26605]
MTNSPRARSPWASLVRLFARLRADRKGGVLMIMGFAIIPLTFATGFGIDYARAMRLQTHLNSAADAAALAAVSPAMILLSRDQSKAAADRMFDSQSSVLSGVQSKQWTSTITDGTTGSGQTLAYLRTATVTYTAQSTNIFGGILGATTLTVHGTASANAAQPPNVDFYLAMDNSPSMLLPATSDGIRKVQDVTGCAFSCHEYLPHNDNINVKNSAGLQVLLSSSYYTANAANQNVYYLYNPTTKLLFDKSGNPMNSSTTSTTQPTTTNGGTTSNPSTTSTTVTTVTTNTYSIADNNNGPVTITKTTKATPTTNSTTTPKTGNPTSSSTPGTPTSSSSTYDTGYWADGYWLTHNYGLLYGSPDSIVLRKDEVVAAATQLIPFAANQAQQYQVTYQAQMFSFDWSRPNITTPVQTLNQLTDVASYPSNFSASSLFPGDDYWWQNSQPAKGTSNNDQATEMLNMLTAMNNIIPTAGSGAKDATPQKILFLVTDGMVDQPSRYFGPLRSNEQSVCTSIKAKGIKIAILYTKYLPEALANDSWSQSNVAPFLPPPPSPYPNGSAGSSDQVLTALQKCASPGTNGAALVQTVSANDSITTALQQLFSTALQTSRLVQ